MTGSTLAEQPRQEVDPATITHCNVPTAGTPLCGEREDPGSSSPRISIAHHVGNPIDVISGNKYQGELDYRSPTSALTLQRHYNSSLSAIDTGIGRGWRHTFQVVLSRVGEDVLQIVQSDGRTLRFTRTGDDALYHSTSGSDGHVQLGDHGVWTLADGRRLIFQGSWLVQIQLGERAGTLTLKYRNGRLATVDDGRGGVLRFRYVAARDTLPAYGSSQAMQPVGALASVGLPGGDEIRYRYGHFRNLISVVYPDGEQIDYGYDDAAWPSQLTERSATGARRQSHWQYDEQGRGVAWQFGEQVNGLVISRHTAAVNDSLDPASHPANGYLHGASVVRVDGRRTEYRWRTQSRMPLPESLHQTEGGTSGAYPVAAMDDPVVADLWCDNCLPGVTGNTQDLRLTGAMEQAAQTDTQAGKGRSMEQMSQASSVDQGDQAGQTGQTADLEQVRAAAASGRRDFFRAARGMVRHLTLDQNQAGLAPGLVRYRGQFPDPQGAMDVTVVVNREGELRWLVVGESSLQDLLEAGRGGELPLCFEGAWPAEPETFRQDRLRSMSVGKAPCHLDPSVMMELVYAIEDAADWEDRIQQELPPVELPNEPSDETTLEHLPESRDEATGGGSDSGSQRQKKSREEMDSGRQIDRDTATRKRRGNSVPWWSPYKRYCKLPDEMTCETLVEDIEMAHLSRCAYGTGDCAPFFRMVDPSELDLPAYRFDDNGFNAALYQDLRDPANYVLAFRGTDNIGDDWSVNFAQSRSERTRQYDLAVQLSRDVDRLLEEDELRITGHSLGGGLASVGALATGNDATVFNAASLQPGTAGGYGLDEEYSSAENNIRHVHSDSDPVTWLQQIGDDLDFRDIQTAPGETIEIHNPDTPWMNSVYESAETFSEGFWPFIYHSIDAVIFTLEQYWAYNCVV